jgi:hypothetical protein
MCTHEYFLIVLDRRRQVKRRGIPQKPDREKRNEQVINRCPCIAAGKLSF